MTKVGYKNNAWVKAWGKFSLTASSQIAIISYNGLFQKRVGRVKDMEFPGVLKKIAIAGVN